jgi:replication factor A1
MLSQGTMAQISVPKNLEKSFRPLLAQDHVYILDGLNAICPKNKSHSYHHQPYILQFVSTTKVNHLESRGATIPHYAFNFCSFDELPNKSITSKPLIGTKTVTTKQIL